LLEVDESNLEIVSKEVFAPVLTVQRFHDEAEAIRLAYDSEYGPSASAWSRDADRPYGLHWSANPALLDQHLDSDGRPVEEGGFKQSGQGRMRGLAVIDDFI